MVFLYRVEKKKSLKNKKNSYKMKKTAIKIAK